MSDSGSSTTSETGPASRVRGLAQAALRYAEIRGKLLQIEAQEAGVHASKVSVRLILALGALLVAWLLSMPAIVVLLAEALDVRWVFVALGLAAAHLLIGFVLLVAAVHRLRRVRLFEESLNQLQKDREWLAQNPQPPI